jgi:hypothetical protein
VTICGLTFGVRLLAKIFDTTPGPSRRVTEDSFFVDLEAHTVISGAAVENEWKPFYLCDVTYSFMGLC